MQIVTKYLVLMALALVLAAPTTTNAASNLIVVVNGEELSGTCSGGNCEVDLSGDHGGLNFSNNGGTPKVKAIDGAPETLVLEHATIKSLQAGESVITFWATFVAGPVTGGGPPAQKIQYDRTADGSMMRGSSAAKNDLFTINGWVDDLGDASPIITIEPTQYKLVSCPWPSCPSAYGNFSLSTSLVVDTGFQGDRLLKMELRFDAKYVNDKLNLSSAQVVGNTVTVLPGKARANTGVFDSFAEDYILERERGHRRR